jgi:DNA polymerase epsilon subunit 2
MSAQRFALVQQRILKQSVFRPKLVSADGRQASSDGRHVTHNLTPIESLLGRAGVRFLLGMIVQVEEGRYYLEDNTAQVPLDVSEAQILTDGFLTEHCIVLVEGEMVDGVLHVHRMGNPIVETRT